MQARKLFRVRAFFLRDGKETALVSVDVDAIDVANRVNRLGAKFDEIAVFVGAPAEREFDVLRQVFILVFIGDFAVAVTDLFIDVDKIRFVKVAPRKPNREFFRIRRMALVGERRA